MEDGAERRGRVSGHLSGRFPVSLHRGGRRAQPWYPPGRPAASASQGDADSWQPPWSSDYEEEQDRDCEAPFSAAAMLNIFRSIPTQMVGQPPREARPRPGPRPLVAACGGWRSPSSARCRHLRLRSCCWGWGVVLRLILV